MQIVSILGFRDVKIHNVDDFLKRIKTGIHPALVQIIDATRVAGTPHLFFAFLNAQKSFEQGLARSENLEIETLLYASGNRQINKAIEMLGIRSQTSNIAIIIFVSTEKESKTAEGKLIELIPGSRDDDVLEIKGESKINVLKKIFGVRDLEIETMSGIGLTRNEVITWLIVERGALLSIKR